MSEGSEDTHSLASKMQPANAYFYILSFLKQPHLQLLMSVICLELLNFDAAPSHVCGSEGEMFACLIYDCALRSTCGNNNIDIHKTN